ncbi:MAG: hypothetical protein HYW10_06675, partial [Candidatus Omnitrophica bacterium]|nr:hypothetical protein [Candidatus Omnitrophota bacterium]
MSPKQKQIIVVLLLLIGLGGVVLLAARRSLLTSGAGVERVVYYCPMHPTYTSDRPGDCPICNMKLVKRDSEQRAASSEQRESKEAQRAKDICYMHNCPMMKPGQKCPMMVMAKAGEKVVCPVCGTHVVEAAPAQAGGTAEAKKILYWTDPMIPGYKSDKPGKSPMGMDLIPVYEENGAPGMAATTAPEGYAPILVTPQKRQFIGVTTAPAQRRTINKIIRTVGQIANDPELYQAEQEYLQALKALEQAKTGTMPEVTERAQRLVDSSRLRLRRLGL